MASCLIEEVKTFKLEAYGKNKTEAFGKAFAGLQSKVYASLNGTGLLIYMEPLAVDILSEHEQDTVEKIIGFLKPKPTMHYQVEFEVTVKLRYIPLESSNTADGGSDTE